MITNSLKNQIIAFAVFFSLGSTSLAARPACENVFDDAHVASTRVQKNKFVTSRDLWEYQTYLEKGFKEKLESLDENGHWIDLGAGKAQAQIDYYINFKNPKIAAQSTAVCYKLDRWFGIPRFQGKLEVKEGMFEKQNTHDWKKADLISDFFGVISYTQDMTTSLQKTFDLLKVGGELYIHSTNYVTHIQMTEKTVTLTEFLQEIPGIKVEGRFGSLKITKLEEHIEIPEMEIIKYKDEAPPIRVFKIK